MAGHEDEVVALEAAPVYGGRCLVASLDVCGVLKIWDVFQSRCLYTMASDIRTMVDVRHPLSIHLPNVCCEDLSSRETEHHCQQSEFGVVLGAATRNDVI